MNKLKLKPAPIHRNEDHIYTHDLTRELYTGVTTILGVRSADWLKFWTTKRNYEYMMENWDIRKLYTQKEKEDLLLKAKNAHAQRSKEALNTGKKAHLWIEHYLDGKNPPVPQDEKLKNSISSFIEYEKQHKIDWLLSEFVVCSEVYKYAGTLDAYAVVDGKKTLIDFKTSNHFSEDMFIQTAGYQNCLEEMGEIPEQRMIIRIPKDGTKVETLVVPTVYKFDRETFLHLREVHRWNVYIQNLKNNKILK